MSLPKVDLTKVIVAFRKYNTTVGQSVFVCMSTYDMESQNSPWRDRVRVNVLLTHMDELGDRDHLFPFSDGVEK